MNGNTLIVPITDFARHVSGYINSLPNVEEVVITRDSRAVATVKSTPREKNRALLKLQGTWDGSLFDNDEVWKAVAVRRNRKKPIRL